MEVLVCLRSVALGETVGVIQSAMMYFCLKTSDLGGCIVKVDSRPCEAWDTIQCFTGIKDRLGRIDS
jgi:hypothetical protein